MRVARRRDVPVGPFVVGALEGFAAPERECRFERVRLVVVVGVGVGEELVKLVEVDADLGAVQAVAFAFVDERVAECDARVGG
jgi:hypothetical protein